MNYTQQQLQELQEVEINILKEIVHICEDNDIRYFTIGGTTLGAVRHNGFIPWDDDIDIGMLRDDYEKFIAIAPKQLSGEYILQHFSVDAKTPTYHAKVMKKETVFLERHVKHINIEHGIFVDIMPFDKIPINEKQLKKYRRDVFFWRQAFFAKSITLPSSPMEKWRELLFTSFRCMLKVMFLPYSKNKVYNKLQRVITLYNKENTNFISSRGHKEFECSIDDIFPTVEHHFENMVVNIPRNANKLLMRQYGDYMKLPAPELRIGHAPEILDFGEKK